MSVCHLSQSPLVRGGLLQAADEVEVLQPLLRPDALGCRKLGASLRFLVQFSCLHLPRLQ
jgi:hypothetical protein